MPRKPPKKTLKKIKSSMLSRGLSLAKLTINAGASLATENIKNSFSSEEVKNSSWKGFVKNQAEIVTQELGELKGSLMKAGQMLSMLGEHFLPPEANEFLKSLQGDTPALEWNAIENVLNKHLSPEQLEQLEIEHEALSCASLGQVHRARIKKTGESIVLKIQYPKVDKAINSDLKALRSLLSLLKLVPRDLNLDSLFAELREMLEQETDYVQEAQRTQDFYEKLKNDKRFVVPKVYPEFSNKRVLATSYERGLRADDPVIQALPMERRKKLGLHFLDLYFMELFEWRMVQTDPHVGNYRLRLDPSGRDQIVLYDFGATRKYSKEFVDKYARMIEGCVLNDFEMFHQAALDLHFIRTTDPEGLIKAFTEFCFETVEPFLLPDDPRLQPGVMDADGSYDWKNTDLPQRLSKKVFQVVRNYSWRTPPREILFLDRKTGGVFVFLSVLKAKCAGREVLMRHLK